MCTTPFCPSRLSVLEKLCQESVKTLYAPAYQGYSSNSTVGRLRWTCVARVCVCVRVLSGGGEAGGTGAGHQLVKMAGCSLRRLPMRPLQRPYTASAAPLHR
jgi:hypothetical protein